MTCKRWARRLKDERGGALVAAGVMAASFVLLGTVVVEVGQWLQHRRQIQVRADAAALAGGQALAKCFDIGINGATEANVDPQIEAWAKSYGGISGGAAAGTGSPYNPQFGSSSSNLMSFQSDTYPSATNQQPPKNLGTECFQNGDPNGTPNLMLDVKMTQAGIPHIFGFSPFATVHGWARVQAQEIESLRPTLPLAIPDVRPNHVAVTFVNNATGDALAGCANGCVFQLGGPTTSGQLNDWSANVTIPMPAANSNVGMRVGIGSIVGTCAHVNQAATYTCYDYSTTGQPKPNGIIDLRAYDTTTAGTQAAPILRAVTPTTCSGTPFFSIYQATAGTCSAGVTATVDFGNAGPPANTHIRATVNGTNLTLTRSGNTNTWISNATSLPIEGGPFAVTVGWCVGNCNGNNAFTKFNGGNPVQQIFSGSDGSSIVLPGGPIFAASVLDSGNGSADYSFQASHNATLAVTVGLTGAVHLPARCPAGGSGASYTCATDPPILLRFVSGSGNASQTYAIDCGGGNLRTMIENGCVDQYQPNPADVCPDPANPTPPDCAAVQTGAATGQIQQGMNTRFAPNNQCLPNNYPVTAAQVAQTGDQRAVTLIITDFSAFSGSGGSSASDVPVVTFATFYVTGWDGAVSSCNGINEPAPPQDAGPGNGANIWGHFIADINLGAVPNGHVCQPGVTPCAIALVR